MLAIMVKLDAEQKKKLLNALLARDAGGNAHDSTLTSTAAGRTRSSSRPGHDEGHDQPLR